jgi:hypothetical protein
MRENDKYIRKYSEKELAQILQDSGYHSEEWEETDPEEEWLIVQSEVIEDNVIVEDAVKQKTSSIYVYNKWWRSSAVCIQ